MFIEDHIPITLPDLQNKPLTCISLFKSGYLAYPPLLDEMKRIANYLKPETGILLFLEHQPIYTLGRHANPNNITALEQARQMGITIHNSDRGGDVTYHGPGQLVCYPLVHLGAKRRHVIEWVSCMEQSMLQTCAAFGLSATTIQGKPGIFIGKKKIGAVGIAIKQGISHHGLALNVCTNLDHFQYIIPCGLHEHPPTSIQQELGLQQQQVQSITVSAIISKFSEIILKNIQQFFQQ